MDSLQNEPSENCKKMRCLLCVFEMVRFHYQLLWNINVPRFGSSSTEGLRALLGTHVGFVTVFKAILKWPEQYVMESGSGETSPRVSWRNLVRIWSDKNINSIQYTSKKNGTPEGWIYFSRMILGSFLSTIVVNLPNDWRIGETFCTFRAQYFHLCK